MTGPDLRLRAFAAGVAFALVSFGTAARSEQPTTLYLVPNFHPGCMGWLARYSEERNYCLYTYLAHLDRVAKDPSYKFAFSEIPHLITMMEYEPKRFDELRQRVKEGRVECVNAFVLEPTISLSGGEALVQQGVQGLRWYRQIMDLQPRFCWMIDTCGWHEQMAQIVSGLGLDAFVYCRYNPTGAMTQPSGAPHGPRQEVTLHWIQSPDGTRALAVSTGHYCDPSFAGVFETRTPLAPDALRNVIDKVRENRKRFPMGAPILLLGGEQDYSGPFRYENYPAELIAAWNKAAPDLQLRMATPSDYLDVILPPLRAGQYQIPTVASGSAIYGWTSFWMNMPIVKQWYRRAEHGLQAAEALATIATLTGSVAYPSQEFANAWLLMALNMDRNILWGVAVDGSFRDRESWDTCDRFEYVDSVVAASNGAAFGSLVRQDPDAVTLFNPVNWARKGPVELTLPPGRVLAGVDCQLLEDGRTLLARMPLPSVGLAAGRLEQAGWLPPARTALPEVIETPHYSAKLDAATGALVSLRMKPSGREMLGGPANVVLAEEKGDPHFVPEKAKRKLLANSNQHAPFITVTTGKLATIVEMRGPFHGGGELRRVIRFYNESPRIDFVTETNGLPEKTVLSVEFPLADDVTEMRRGIPYGFSRGDCVNGVPGVTGVTKGILPAIRWSDYSFRSGGGLAILDRGVTGRELVGKTAILLLHNVCETYFKFPATWMGDQRKQSYAYAILPHERDWDGVNVARLAWEYNSPVIVAAGCPESVSKSLVETSDNVIVEALRCDFDQIEMRLVECLGKDGRAWAKVNLPHTTAALTDLLGRKPEALPPGQRYEFAVRPQQIVTMRLRTGQTVPPVQALRSFDTVVPQGKRAYMRTARNPRLIGHPPKAPQ